MMFKHLFILIITLITQSAFAAETGVKESLTEISPPVEVIFETSLGPFTLELDPEKAPKTVANFLSYVDAGYYDNTLFHRVIPGFVVQGGGFEKDMKKKPTRAPVENESNNDLKNIGGTISMARTSDPDSATSQFFINLAHNPGLDARAGKSGYTVFGKVTEGIKVIRKIAAVPTKTTGPYKDVPREDVVILSAQRKGGKVAKTSGQFIAGEHYIVLDRPVPTRDNNKIEVVEMFSYGCPHCYEFEPLIREWSKQQSGDIDFWAFPAVWNKSMELYAQAFYAARELNVSEIIHHPLFTAIVVEQSKISNESELADFFSHYGVDKEAFSKAFGSTDVKMQAGHAEERVRLYKPAGVPEIIVNGKYRVDRMRAGGLTEMLAVVDYLVMKERALKKK